MAKKQGVPGKTHTKKQLDNYANQNKPNNKAYVPARKNAQAMHQRKVKKGYIDNVADLEWFCYGWCSD